MRKVRRKKITPRLCSLGSTVWEQEKHLSNTKAHTRHSHRGSESGPSSSHLIPQPLIRRWSDPLDQASGSKRTEANGRGGERKRPPPLKAKEKATQNTPVSNYIEPNSPENPGNLHEDRDGIFVAFGTYLLTLRYLLLFHSSPGYLILIANQSPNPHLLQNTWTKTHHKINHFVNKMVVVHVIASCYAKRQKVAQVKKPLASTTNECKTN